MKTIVLSGINLYTGGTLKIMQDCIASLSAYVGKEYKILALVHNEKQYPAYSNVEYLSFPKSRKSWLFRLYYEYIGFKKLSKKWQPYAWFSLHDTTPNVEAEMRLVYCHNTFSFYKGGLNAFRLQPSIWMFSIFSKYIHKVNIRKNTYVIVQQEWLRKAFEDAFAIHNVVVALPVDARIQPQEESIEPVEKKGPFLFFYPATPMVHKNYEVIGDAVKLLHAEGITDFRVVLTMNGTENKYARYIDDRYGNLENIYFSGFLSREKVNEYYAGCDCVLFPSKIESWGLPVSEAIAYRRPILIADLPYAKETIGNYSQAKFFDPDNAQELAGYMKSIMNHRLHFDKTYEIKIEEPYSQNWNELFNFLFTKNNG